MRSVKRLGAAIGVLVVLVVLVVVSGKARANGRFPQAGQIAIDPRDPNHIVLRTTYGLVQSTDGGLAWRWICEPAAYPNGYDPAILVTGNGSVLTASDGVSRSTDRGCAWTRADAPLRGQFVTDLALDGASLSHAIASAIPIDQTEGFRGVFAETFDDGATWVTKGAFPPDFRALTVELAPSSSASTRRIYAAGLGGNPLVAQLARSDDGGATWTLTTLDLAGGTPWISAVDPHDAAVVYLRVDAFPGDRLLVSRDGGGTFADAYLAQGDLLGFALSPDGSRVALGGPDDGLLVASAQDLAFTKVNELRPQCLTWTASGLFVCADATTESFSAGVSHDEGRTVQPLYRNRDLAPLECARGATSDALCPLLWPGIAATLGADAGAPVDASAGNDAGAPDAGVPANADLLDARGGCSCSTADSSGASSGNALLTAAAIAFAAYAAGRRAKARGGPSTGGRSR